MSLGNLMGGSLDIQSLLQALQQSGGNITIINPGAGMSAPLPSGMGAGGPPMPPEMPPMPGDDAMISNGAPPALGPGPESPIEEAPTDMMGAVKAGLAKSKAPSPGVGKGPSKPVTKAGSAKMPEKKAPEAKSDSKKAPPKKAK
jgi:hypothetical protein